MSLESLENLDEAIELHPEHVVFNIGVHELDRPFRPLAGLTRQPYLAIILDQSFYEVPSVDEDGLLPVVLGCLGDQIFVEDPDPELVLIIHRAIVSEGL